MELLLPFYKSILIRLGWFFLSFFWIHVVHFRFFPGEFTGKMILSDLLMTSLFVWSVSFFLERRVWVSRKARLFLTLNAYVIFLPLITLYGILGPVMADRSLSVFLLEAVAKHSDSGVDLTSLIEETNQKYIRGDQMVAKRVSEQVKSGAFSLEGQKLKIASRGKIILAVYRLIYQVLGMGGGFWNRSPIELGSI